MNPRWAEQARSPTCLCKDRLTPELMTFLAFSAANAQS